MLRLVAVIYVLVSTVVGGVFVTALLAMNMMDGWKIAAAFVAGMVVALPISYVVGKKIYTAVNATPGSVSHA